MTKEQLKEEARESIQPYKDKILGIDDYNWGQDKFMDELVGFVYSLIDKAYEEGKKECHKLTDSYGKNQD